MNETATLAKYAIEASLDDVPSAVRERAKMLILDHLGCQLAGSALPWSARIAGAIVPLSAPGRSTVVQSREGLTPDAAAFVNSAYGHANETDDTHLKSPTHPGSVVIPSAIAVAEADGRSGRELLEAVVVGYEMMLRISYAVSPNLLLRGHHPPVAVGPFASAALAARLQHLDVDRTVNAMAIAGSSAAGLTEYVETGGTVKRLHCAIPAQAGVRAAALARVGVTGPPTVLEGARGFCAVFSHDNDLSWLTRELSTRYLLLETSIKTYSCCHLIHAALDAVKVLQAERDIAPDDIATVRVHTRNPAVVKHVATIVEPHDTLEAQFSMAYCVAMQLGGYAVDWWQVLDIPLGDPVVTNLAHRVSILLSEEVGTSKFDTGVRVEIEMHDGATLAADVLQSRGEPERPLSAEEIYEKFRLLAEPIMDADRAKRLFDLVLGLEDLPTLTEIGTILRKAPAA